MNGFSLSTNHIFYALDLLWCQASVLERHKLWQSASNDGFGVGTGFLQEISDLYRDILDKKHSLCQWIKVQIRLSFADCFPTMPIIVRALSLRI